MSNEEYMKQCCEPQRRPEPCPEPCPPDPCRPDPCGDQNGNGGWESWLPILVILFFLCGGWGGNSGFGGNPCGDNCGNGGGSWSWFIGLIVLYCLFCNGNGNNGRGGLFGGLF